MSSVTPKLGLTKPAGSDLIDISVLNGNFDILDGSSILVFQTLADLQTALPNGHTRPVWVVADNEWYYWTGALAVNISSVVATSTTTAITPILSIGGNITVSAIVATSNTQAIAPVISIPGNLNISAVVATAITQALNPTLSTSVNVSAALAQSTTVANAPTITITTPDTTPPNAVTSLAAGTLNVNSINVTWQPSSSSDTANYEIAYSTDGTNYTVSGTVGNMVYGYTVTGLSANTSYTIRVIAIDGASNRSTAVTVSATTLASGTTDTTVPVMKAYPSSSIFASNAPISVTLVADETATIYYTTNGSTPTTSSSVYSSPISISATTTLKYYAVDPSSNASAVATQTYTKATFAKPNNITVTSGLTHAFDFSAGVGNAVADTVGSLSIPLSAYKIDGTGGFIAGTGLRGDNTGYGLISTTTGLPTQGTSFSVSLLVSLNASNYGVIFFSSTNQNNQIGNYNAGNGENQASTLGRFNIGTTSVGALHVQPQVQVQDSSTAGSTTGIGLVNVVRSDASTASSTVLNEVPCVLTVTYDQPSKTVSLYLNGTMSASKTIVNDLKFDGILVSKSFDEMYSILIHNRVLSSSEITQVSNDLLA